MSPFSLSDNCWHFYFTAIFQTIYNQNRPETSEIYEFVVGRFSDSYLAITHKITTPDNGKHTNKKKIPNFSQS